MAFLTISLALGLSALAAASPLQNNIQTPSWSQTETYHDLTAGKPSDLGTVGHYTLVPAIWTGQIFPSQPSTTIRGRTLESILNYIQTLNPDLQSTAPAPVGAVSKAVNVPGYTHDCGFGGYPCFMQCQRDNFGKGRVQALDEAMGYLRSHWPAGSLAHVLGPQGSCTQVTCSWDSALFYCNDGTRGQDDQFMNFSEIADYAQDMKNACMTGGDFNGQRFRTDLEYSVLFARSSSHC